jgi:hypothetical protein
MSFRNPPRFFFDANTNIFLLRPKGSYSVYFLRVSGSAQPCTKTGHQIIC